MTTKDAEPAKPTLYRKIISGANWGMLAGFWVELPLMAAFLFKPFKPKDLSGWAKVSEWSVKLVLPATLGGVVYGFTKPARDGTKARRAADNEASGDALPASTKSWVRAEQERADQDSHLSL